MGIFISPIITIMDEIFKERFLSRWFHYCRKHAERGIAAAANLLLLAFIREGDSREGFSVLSDERQSMRSSASSVSSW